MLNYEESLTAVMFLIIDCGKQHFWEVSSEITSPAYPDSYGPSQQCVYVIHNPFNNVLVISFQTFDLEYQEDCDYDYLMVGICCHGAYNAIF